MTTTTTTTTMSPAQKYMSGACCPNCDGEFVDVACGDRDWQCEECGHSWCTSEYQEDLVDCVPTR